MPRAHATSATAEIARLHAIVEMVRCPGMRGVFFFCSACALACACVSYALPDLPPDQVDASPPPPTTPPPVDAGDADAPLDASRNCTADLDDDGLPHHLDCTGLYADYAAKTVAAENRMYKPANELWSDGAVKTRWLYLPPAAKIDISTFDTWQMPNGTRVWKEFIVDGRRIETRMFTKSTTGSWQHTLYRWNADESDATRYDFGDEIPRDGGAPYEIPNVGKCGVCHDNRADKMLGVDAIGLGLPGAEGLTLATLAAEGRLSAAPPATSFTLPDDATGKAAAALGVLHANCGICHTSDGFAGGIGLLMRVHVDQLLADAGAQALDAYTTAVCVQATRPNPDGGGPIMRIAGGDPNGSLISVLSGKRVPPGDEPNADSQMPPLVTRVVDTQGHAKLDAWITALPACP
jgi:hypothetical protein